MLHAEYFSACKCKKNLVWENWKLFSSRLSTINDYVDKFEFNRAERSAVRILSNMSNFCCVFSAFRLQFRKRVLCTLKRNRILFIYFISLLSRENEFFFITWIGKINFPRFKLNENFCFAFVLFLRLWRARKRTINRHGFCIIEYAWD